MDEVIIESDIAKRGKADYGLSIVVWRPDGARGDDLTTALVNEQKSER